MLFMITPPTRSRCSQYTVKFPPGRHARPDDGPVTGPKHVVCNSDKYYTTIFGFGRLLLPLHHIMYTTGMLQLKLCNLFFPWKTN